MESILLPTNRNATTKEAAGAYTSSHDLNYDVKQTELMVFKYGREPNTIEPVILNGATLNVVQIC